MERKKKILLIEDNLKLLNNLKIFLENSGFFIDTAVDGENGIKKTFTWNPDLIICDISIPVKNGYQVLTELSKNNNTKRIPFIFLTAKVDKEDFRKGMKLGADDYILKPFDLDDLIASIENRFEKSNNWQKNEIPALNGNDKTYKFDDKFLIKFGKKMEYFNVKDIKFIRTEHPYVYLKFGNNKNTLLRDSLNKWEAKLPKDYFLRISQSSIINTEFVIKIEKINRFSYFVKIKDENEPFVVSRRFNNRIKSRLPK